MASSEDQRKCTNTRLEATNITSEDPVEEPILKDYFSNLLQTASFHVLTNMSVQES